MARASTLITACLVVSASFTTHAAFVTPSGWLRPSTVGEAASTATTYQQWNILSSTTGPNAPDVASINPAGTANLIDSAAPASGSFVTGGGNLYSFGGVIVPRITIPQSGDVAPGGTQVLLQFKVIGAAMATDQLLVNGISASNLADYSYQLLSSVPVSGGFGGATEEHAWFFTVPGHPSVITIDVNTGFSSVSLDVVSVDTAVIVPEPMGAPLLGICLPLLARRKR